MQNGEHFHIYPIMSLNSNAVRSFFRKGIKTFYVMPDGDQSGFKAIEGNFDWQHNQAIVLQENPDHKGWTEVRVPIDTKVRLYKREATFFHNGK